jgi:predicted Rossmann-fold nucleotide-binding protein
VMPGGIGTLDEFFEAMTLIQTKKILSFPIVVMEKAYWQPLVEMMRRMVVEKTIDEEDLHLMLLTDSVTEAIEHIHKHAIDAFGLHRREAPEPSKLLGEPPSLEKKIS